MNKKGTFDLPSYVIGLLLVMGILVTLSSVYYTSASKYGISSTSLDEASSFNATYNQIDTITELTGTVNDQLIDSKTSDETQATTFYGNMLGIGKKIYNTITLPITLINDMVRRLHVPAIWGIIAISSLIITLVAGFVYLIFSK